MNYTDLIREAAEWRLISLLLECPSGPEWRLQVAALGRESADPVLRAAAEAARDEASEGVHHSIFGPGGPAPAREVSYHDNIQLGYLMSELVNYYQAFAYQPKVEEPEDHVAVETGFIGYLRLKQAYALAGDDAEAEAVTREAAKQFLDDHLSRVAQPLAASLAQSGVSYLAQVSGALLKRVGPPKGLPVMPQPEPADCEMTCGG
ncbi:MAG: molecular chaperone TorD family protein [Bryobacteraceae bacterium]|nr:molecular chaperone TorD family protein [Bryobacteraceae bacterium]